MYVCHERHIVRPCMEAVKFETEALAIYKEPNEALVVPSSRASTNTSLGIQPFIANPVATVEVVDHLVL